MAEKVKASTVMVSVGPGSGATEETTPMPGRKKEKKNRKMIRMAGGQIWEDNSLLEWEDGKYYCHSYCMLATRPSWWRITQKNGVAVVFSLLYMSRITKLQNINGRVLKTLNSQFTFWKEQETSVLTDIKLS
jgi:hypothetical protein